jgi:cytochrome b561
MALIVLMLLATGKIVFPGISPEDPQKAFLLQMHSFSGAILAVLLIARLVMRFTVKMPAPADAGNAFLNIVGKVVHVLLYVMVFGMAASGVGLFTMADLPSVFSGAAPYPQNFFDFLPRMGHGLTSWILLVLALLHIGAAFFHQFIRKDNLIARMWFGK